MKNKIEIIKSKIEKIINEILSYIKLNLKKIILFEMLYKLIVFLIFTPLISYVIKVSIKGMGFFNLTNNELINLGIKIPGLIGIILIVLVAFIVIFIELGVLTYIANMTHNRKKASITNGIIITLKRLPSTIGIYILPILLICIVMGPIGGVGLSGSLIKNISIPLFIKVELLRTDYGFVFLTLAIIMAVIISIRWILFLPITVIEKTSLKEALIKSKKIYKQHRFSIIKYLLLWIVINVTVRLTFYVLYTSLGSIIAYGEFVSKLYLFIFIIVHTILSIITTPLFIMFLVEIYYKLTNYKASQITLNESYNLTNNNLYTFMVKNKKTVFILITLLFSAIIFYNSYNTLYKSTNKNNIQVTAHRGNNIAAPENSIPSVKLAKDSFADCVEIDVMTTKDNKVIVFHDSTTKRFNGNNTKIKDMTLEEVKKIDIGSEFDKRIKGTFNNYKGEKIPTLEEVLKEFKGKIKFNIELKPSSKNDELEKEVAKLIKKYDMESEVIISSLNYNSIQKFKEENLNVKIGYILTFGVGDFTTLDIDFISVEYGMLSKKLVNNMHKLGKEVHVWTLNDESEIINAASLGVDNIITDNVWSCVATLQMCGYKIDKEFNDTNVNYETWLYNNIWYILKYINI